MANMEINAIPSFSEIQRKFNALGKKIDDHKTLWELIHKDFGEVEKLVFASKGAYAGSVWEPLKKRYANQKRKSGYAGRGLLVRTGKTKAYLVSGANAIKAKNTLTIRINPAKFPMWQNRHQRFKREVFDYTGNIANRWGKITGQWLENEVMKNGV